MHSIYIIFILGLHVSCNAESDNDKSTVKFLLSDAKDPEFDLEQYQERKVEDMDVSESIILPTLNIESHPFAVVVLPNLKNIPSLGFDGFASMNQEDRSDASRKREVSKSDIKTVKITPLHKPNELPVFLVPEVDDATVELELPESDYKSQEHGVSSSISVGESNSSAQILESQQANVNTSISVDDSDSTSQNVTLQQIDESGSSINVNESELKSVQNNTESTSDNMEKSGTHENRGKSISGLVISKISDFSNEKVSLPDLKGYPRREGDLLFSPFQVSLDSKSSKSDIPEQKMFNQPTFTNQKLSKAIRNGATTDEKQTIQTLPIVEQFSFLENIVPPFRESEFTSQNSVSKNQLLTSDGTNTLSDSDVKVKTDSAITDEKELLKTSDDFLSDEINQSTNNKPKEFEQDSRKDVPLTNQGKSLTRSSIISSFDKPIIQSFSQEIPTDVDLDISIENDFTRNQKSLEMDQSLFQILTSNSTVSNFSFPTNTFDFVRSIGIPLPEFANLDITETISGKSTTNSGVVSNAGHFTAEQTDQIKQLIKQISLLDTAAPLQKNIKSNDQDLDPEKVIGSFTVERSDEDDEDEPEKLGKKLLNNSQNKPNVNQNLILIPSEVDLLSGENTFEHNIKDTQKINLAEEFSPNQENVKTNILNWSNFLKIKNNRTKPDSQNRVKITENDDEIRYSSLESIKTPIETPFIVNSPSEINTNRTLNVVLESFDISNAIPPIDQREVQDPIDNFNPLSRSKVSLNDKYHPTDSKKTNSDIKASVLRDNRGEPSIQNVATSQNNFLSEERLQTGVPLPTIDLEASRDAPQIFTGTANHGKSDYQDFHVSQKIQASSTEDCSDKTVGCEDVSISRVTKDVTRAVTSTVFDFVPEVVTRALPVTQTIVLTETKRNTSIVTVTPDSEEVTVTRTVTLTSKIVEPRTVGVVSKVEPLHFLTQTHFHKYTKVDSVTTTTTLSNLTVTSPVHKAMIEPTTIITTSYMIHNILTLHTVTQEVTVTVMTPSPVLYTETKVVNRTKFITVTSVTPPELRHTSTILHVIPNPSTITLQPTPLTITKTVDSVSIVTHTLFSTICNTDQSNERDLSQLNSYGINPTNLLKNLRPKQLHKKRPQFRKKALEERQSTFDEVYWPKEVIHNKRDAWPYDDFNKGFYNVNYEPIVPVEHTSTIADSDIQESNQRVASVLPEQSQSRTGYQRSLDNFSPKYGTPFYGYILSSESN